MIHCKDAAKPFFSASLHLSKRFELIRVEEGRERVQVSDHGRHCAIEKGGFGVDRVDELLLENRENPGELTD